MTMPIIMHILIKLANMEITQGKVDNFGQS